MKTGTLKELNVKPGDVVRLCGGARVEYTIDKIIDGDVYGDETDCPLNDVGGGFGWELISRADTPTLWRDMTPEEKGALLLAHHEGKEIEYSRPAIHGWRYKIIHDQSWRDQVAYRIKPSKPQPKVVTVDLMADFKVIGTINLIDSKPDPASIKMEPL